MGFLRLVQDSGLGEFPTRLQLVSEGVEKRMAGYHTVAIRKISQKAKGNFAEAIQRRAHSATVGDGPYGAGRVSGQFTFGEHLTFVGKLIGNKGGPIQGLGYPDEQRADDRTEKVWRFLEEGATYRKWPRRGLWFNPGGNPRWPKPEAGRDDVLRVTPRGAPLNWGPAEISPRWYIRNAVQDVLVEYLEPRYEQILDKSMKDVFGQ